MQTSIFIAKLLGPIFVAMGLAGIINYVASGYTTRPSDRIALDGNRQRVGPPRFEPIT